MATPRRELPASRGMAPATPSAEAASLGRLNERLEAYVAHNRALQVAAEAAAAKVVSTQTT
jgi:hypothetical protein